jgi:hypothetical protein
MCVYLVTLHARMQPLKLIMESFIEVVAASSEDSTVWTECRVTDYYSRW